MGLKNCNKTYVSPDYEVFRFQNIEICGCIEHKWGICSVTVHHVSMRHGVKLKQVVISTANERRKETPKFEIVSSDWESEGMLKRGRKIIPLVNRSKSVHCEHLAKRI